MSVEPCPCYDGRELACPIHGPLSSIDTPRDERGHPGIAWPEEDIAAAEHQLAMGQTTPLGDYASDVGTKDDDGKPRTDLLPFAALTEVAHVMTFGAKKYGPYNWHGLSASRLFGAALRHLWAFWTGEDNDPETGRSHVAHAAACVLMVLEQVLERPRYDDRPNAPVPRAAVRVCGSTCWQEGRCDGHCGRTPE